MSMMKRNLDEQIQHKRSQAAHEKYQQQQFESQVLKD